METKTTFKNAEAGTERSFFPKRMSWLHLPLIVGCALALSLGAGCGKEDVEAKSEAASEAKDGLQVGSKVLCTPPESWNRPGGPFPAEVQKIDGDSLEVVYDTGSFQKTTRSNCKLDETKAE